jgi:asparagine synthase (glutamine-hydrolysing)
LLDDLDSFVGDQEEPFGSTSIYAQWRVMRAAREAGVIVLLDGQGADELFAGYPGTVGWILRSLGPRVALRELIGDRGLADDLAIAYFSQRAPRALVRRYRLQHASPYVTADVAHEAAAEAELAPEGVRDGSALRRELCRQAFSTSLPHLCRYADRDSMAHSVEVRLPFLDRRVADFALSLSPRLVFDDGVTKRLLRDTLRGLVPDMILDRREKVGYETPEEAWFGMPGVRARFGEILLDPATASSGRYDIGAVEQDLSNGAWRDLRAVWRAVNVELWLRVTVRAGAQAEVARP